MPLFAQMVAGFFTALSGFLLKLFAAKVAIRVVAVAAIGALGTALLATFNGLVAPMVSAVFSTSYGQLLGLVFPPVSGTILAGLLLLWAACLTYKLHVQVIKMTANI